MSEIYDVAVVGGGTAGLTAGLFAARYGLRVVVLERLMPGGQVVNAERIENFPGLVQPVAGFDVGPLLLEQAEQAGAEFRIEEVTGLTLEDPLRVLETTEGRVQARAVVLAGGSSLRKLGLPREEEMHGAGVSYCATCDGSFFTDQVVGVVGGGDSAMDEALTLTEFASQVLVFHRRGAFTRAQQVLQDRVLGHPKIAVRWNAEVTGLLGDGQLEGVAVRDTATGEKSRVGLAGLFIFVGLEPNTSFLKGVVPLDAAGHVSVDLRMQTPVRGVFAAGDIRQHSAALLAASAGDGATAAASAWRYVRGRAW